MWFKLAVPGIILVILSLVFFDVAVLGSRFTGINKPKIKDSQETNQDSKPQTSSSSAQLTLQNSPSPASTSVTPSPSSKATPQASVKAIIGSITVLQNNTSSSTQTSSSQTTGSANISGTIDLSGTIPSGTSLVIVARPNGTSNNFQTVVSGISASDNATWTWATAASGTVYDLIAILKGVSGGNNIDYAKSQTYVVTAPAYNQIFAVNAGFTMSAPTATITTTCTTHNSDNTWAATVNYPAVSGGQMYILHLGTTSGSTDIVNSTTTGQTASATLNDSVNYYAEYAVSSVPNPTSAQYSTFSTPMTVRCP